MKRRIFALILTLSLLFSISAQAAAPFGAVAALTERSRTYEGQFADVARGSWYYPYVAASYEYGLFTGRGRDFAPDAEITVAELLTLSARIHAAYEGDAIPAAAADKPWYAPYVAYLSEHSVLDRSLTDFDTPATRAQLAGIFAYSLPEDCYDDLNAALVNEAYASRDFITDVDDYTPYQPQILWLYRQGLLTGMDETGSYWPDCTTTRAEVAAVVTRMVDPALRITLDWVVRPYRSAAGTTFASLVEAPAHAPAAPSYFEPGEIDAALRKMLAAGENTLTLRYPRALAYSDASALVHAFLAQAKTYCEQMYNTVKAQPYSDGTVVLSFSASGCSDETLARYRSATMARAIEVHDMLWETGQLSADMSQYEIARVYFRWLCDNCTYDHRDKNNDYSLSHIAYAALVHGKAVCDGYTGAYNLFLKLEGIECTALANDTHIWTVAALDGTEYHIDTTWGDQTGYIAEQYFGMTAEQSYREHPW